MNILDNIELIDLAIYTHKTLIVTDFHLGFEEALNKQGVMVPRFQFKETMERLETIFKKLKNKKLERIIVNGDLKHEFGTISDQEWRHTLKLIDFLSEHCNELILIKGNHDAILAPIANKRKVTILDYFMISAIKEKTMKNYSIIKKSLKKLKRINENKKILVMHGDKIPNKELLKNVSTIIIGHEHPAVSIKEGPRVEIFKSYLIGKWKKYNLIAQPSFNLVTEGTDILKEHILSPFLKGNLKNFKAIIVSDKLYGFGKLKDLS